jgi:hypothetical protein
MLNRAQPGLLDQGIQACRKPAKYQEVFWGKNPAEILPAGKPDRFAKSYDASARSSKSERNSR